MLQVIKVVAFTRGKLSFEVTFVNGKTCRFCELNLTRFIERAEYGSTII